LRTMIATFPQCVLLLDSLQRQVLEVYGAFNGAQWARMRQVLLSFFQDRRVKVSLFLQDGLQTADGMVVVTHKGPLPVGGERPGTVRVWTNGNRTQSAVAVANAQLTSPPPAPFDMASPLRPCRLGENLYSADRKRTGMAAAKPTVMEPESQPFKPTEVHQKAAKAELSMLASLMGVSTDGKGKTQLNLFPDDLPIDTKSGGANDVIVFDAQDRKATESLLKQFGNLDIGLSDEAGEEDDLLALMDGADS
jgi:hypothetical protein